MGLWECLIGTGSASSQQPGQVLAELRASYREEIRLTQQIRAHAEQSPHQAGAQELRAVADGQEQIVQLLREYITARGGEVQDNVGLLKTGKNHWARVVHDLNDSQALERRYIEQAIDWDPEVPDAAAFFYNLAQQKSRLNALLRDVALRADPHALN
jgi:hypothetical protein